MKTLGFLRRNLALAPRHTKEVAYKTLVRPQLEYAAPIWHPHNETETKKGGESAEDSSHTVGNQKGSFQRKYAFPIPFGGRDGSFQRKLVDEDF